MTTDGPQVEALPSLPGDLDACHAMIVQLLDQLHRAGRKMTQMEHQLQQLLRRLYGRSREKIDPKQMALFAEMLRDLEAQTPPTAAIEPPAEPPVKAPKAAGHGRRRLPAELPRERRIHDLPEDEKPCPCCGR